MQRMPCFSSTSGGYLTLQKNILNDDGSRKKQFLFQKTGLANKTVSENLEVNRWKWMRVCILLRFFALSYTLMINFWGQLRHSSDLTFFIQKSSSLLSHIWKKKKWINYEYSSKGPKLFYSLMCILLKFFISVSCTEFRLTAYWKRLQNLLPYLLVPRITG